MSKKDALGFQEPGKPYEAIPEATPRKVSSMDPALRAAARMERIIDELPYWARVWSIRFLEAKYLTVEPRDSE
jgi:hypothetical protein